MTIVGNLEKVEGEVFNYRNTDLTRCQNGMFLRSYRSFQGPWKGFLTGNLSGFKLCNENGGFQNERFLDNSLGPSEQLQFSNLGSLKLGLSYQFTGRHWAQVHGGIINRSPTLQNSFINPRENNEHCSRSSIGKGYLFRPQLFYSIARFNGSTDRFLYSFSKYYGH